MRHSQSFNIHHQYFCLLKGGLLLCVPFLYQAEKGWRHHARWGLKALQNPQIPANAVSFMFLRVG